MESALELLHWLCMAVGATVLSLIAMALLAAVVVYFWMNWATVVDSDSVFISRITGLRSVHWFMKDPIRDTKQFGTSFFGREKLILNRNLNTALDEFPIWEIYHHDLANGEELVISFFSADKISVRKNEKGPRWSVEMMSVAKFQLTRYNVLVQRAIDLQTDIEKRFKHILIEAAI